MALVEKKGFGPRMVMQQQPFVWSSVPDEQLELQLQKQWLQHYSIRAF